jgi:hypothetical protein
VSKYPIPGTEPDTANCNIEFTLFHEGRRFHCTRPPYHRGPHYDGYLGYWFGYDSADEDPITKANWDYRRAAEKAEATKRSKRAKRRKLWGQVSQDLVAALTLRNAR